MCDGMLSSYCDGTCATPQPEPTAHPPAEHRARLELLPVDLACGHQRRVDPGIGSLVVAGLIDHMWCLRCAADQPTATTTTDGAAVHEGDTHA